MLFDGFHAPSVARKENRTRWAKSAIVTTSGATVARSERNGVPPPRIIERRRGLPGSRAVVGALLMAVAAVGVFVAYTDATQGTGDRVVVAARALRVGEPIEPDDLRTIVAELPNDVAGRTFGDPASLVGRVVLGPIDPGEILQHGSVTDDRGVEPVHEVGLTLPREQVAVGRLKQGERVDVYVTLDDRTSSVVRGAQVVQITEDGGSSLASARELTLVVAVPSGDAVAALVHALRTGDVTVVRSTFGEADTTDPIVFNGEGDEDQLEDPSESEADG